jgi:acid phosphatase
MRASLGSGHWHAIRCADHATRILAAACAVILSTGAPADAFAGTASRAQSSQTSEPANLDLLKQQARDYRDSGAYDAALARTLRQARDYIRQRALRNRRAGERKMKRLALILDIDETSLSNWPALVANDFGFIPNGTCTLLPGEVCGFKEWIGQHKAAAIGPTVDLFNVAKANGVAVFFVTGRTEDQRDATVENLHTVGYEGWTGLVLKPNDRNCTPQQFKTSARKEIEREGYKIIANVGDQMSDLAGDYAERTFKLSNPFYLIAPDKSPTECKGN